MASTHHAHGFDASAGSGLADQATLAAVGREIDDAITRSMLCPDTCSRGFGPTDKLACLTAVRDPSAAASGDAVCTRLLQRGGRQLGQQARDLRRLREV